MIDVDEKTSRVVETDKEETVFAPQTAEPGEIVYFCSGRHE